MSILMLELMYSGSNANTRSAEANARVSALTLKSNIYMYFANDTSWAQIRALPDNATSMACLQTGQPCTAGPFAIQSIVDAGGAHLYTSNGTEGFNLAGQSCAKTSSPDPSCPFTLDLQWAPQCATSPCIPALITITGTVRYDGTLSLVYNSAHYQFTVVRAP